jgi:hypothetical protein
MTGWLGSGNCGKIRMRHELRSPSHPAGCHRLCLPFPERVHVRNVVRAGLGICRAGLLLSNHLSPRTSTPKPVVKTTDAHSSLFPLILPT